MDKKPIKKEKLTKKVKSSISKINKASNEKRYKPSKVPWLEDYRDILTGELRPINDGFLDRLGRDLIEFAESTEGPLRIEWFFTSRRIPFSTAKNWAARYDNFKEPYNIAKYIIGMRREDGALRKQFDRESVFKSLHIYDPEFLEIAQFHAKLKQEVLSGMEGTKVIVLDKLFEDKEPK